jgi:HEAT repeats
MSPEQPNSKGELRPETPQIGIRFVAMLGLTAVIFLLAAAHPASIRAAWAEIERIIQLKSAPLPASPARLSEHESETLDSMTPQKQAQLLLERAINHYDGAIELIDLRVGGWYGQLKLDPEFNGLLDAAINSNDLRVRAASIEIYLATYNLPKNSESALSLLDRIEQDPQWRPFGLWMLGALANRGVEPERLQTALFDRLHDPDENTRRWTVEGIALLGTNASIEPLLDTFHNDASPAVRERAACGLAQSGMLTKEQRMTAVPEILKFTDDPALDHATQTWAFQALRDITGASIGNDPAAWRAWLSGHSQN